MIEVSIPFSLTRRSGASRTRGDEEEEEDECFICAHPFCADDKCARSLMHARCCSQPACCGCMVKLARACTCSEDCEAVVALCPFCREIVPLNVLEVFHGTRAECAACRGPAVANAATTAAAAATVTPTPAPTCEDTPGSPAEESEGSGTDSDSDSEMDEDDPAYLQAAP